MELESIIIRMAIFIAVNGLMIRKMDMELIFIKKQMKNMMGNSK